MSYSMQSGDFKHPITIERIIDTDTDQDGTTVNIWKTILQAKAKVVNVHGEEFLQAFGVGSKITKTFYIRACRGIRITNEDRLIYDGVIYNITYPNDIEERGKYIEIKCEAAK